VWDNNEQKFIVTWGHEDNQSRYGWFNPDDESWLWYMI